MLNRVILLGRLCADPEMKQTANGNFYCKFLLAVNRPYKKDAQQQEADFITVCCWNKTAEFVCRYFSKGKMILVEGSLRNNNYSDQNGVKHYQMDVLANSVGFGGDSKSDTPQESQESSAAAVPAAQPVPQFGTVPPPAQNPLHPVPAAQPVLPDIDGFEDILSDGELPF